MQAWLTSRSLVLRLFSCAVWCLYCASTARLHELILCLYLHICIDNIGIFSLYLHSTYNTVGIASSLLQIPHNFIMENQSMILTSIIVLDSETHWLFWKSLAVQKHLLHPPGPSCMLELGWPCCMACFSLGANCLSQFGQTVLSEPC